MGFQRKASVMLLTPGAINNSISTKHVILNDDLDNGDCGLHKLDHRSTM
jgi:hypothetical protein